MRSTRNLVIAAATTAVALATFSMPAAAALDAALEIAPSVVAVNGLPGMKLDVCVGGKELSSRLRYGRSDDIAIDAVGQYTVKFKKAKVGKCTGKTVTKRTIELASGEKVSVVASPTNGKPKVRFFDNGLNPIPVSPESVSTTLTIHHAAKVGAVDVFRSTQIFNGSALLPDATGLKRGKSVALPAFGGVVSQIWVARTGTKKPIAGPAYREMAPAHNIFVLVGNKLRNFRFAKFVAGAR